MFTWSWVLLGRLRVNIKKKNNLLSQNEQILKKVLCSWLQVPLDRQKLYMKIKKKKTPQKNASHKQLKKKKKDGTPAVVSSLNPSQYKENLKCTHSHN